MSAAPDLESLLRHHAQPREALAALARFGAKNFPWSGWKKLAEYDDEADRAELRTWLLEVLDEEPPPPPTQAFSFALFDAEDARGRETLGLQVVGSSIFVPFDPGFSWANDPDWIPEGRFAPEGVLDEIYRRARNVPRDAREFACYTFGLAYAVTTISLLANELREDLQLWSSGGRQVAVGFLGGEAILLPDPERTRQLDEGDVDEGEDAFEDDDEEPEGA